MPLFNIEDKINIKDIAVPKQFDFLSIPGIQSGREIQEARSLLGKDAEKMRIIAKIDTLEAV